VKPGRPLRLAALAVVALACAAPPVPPRRTPARRYAPAPAPAPKKPAGPGPVTAANWRTHPSVEAVRRLVADGEAAIAARRWPRTDSQVCAPGSSRGGFGLDRAVYLDERSHVRKYVVSEGTDEAAYRLEHHYDEQGRLRFALGTGGAMNGATVRASLWFGEDGAFLWMERKRAGAAYPFPDTWPEDSLVRDPSKDFVRPGPSGCAR
jgi:hypothetical protein